MDKVIGQSGFNLNTDRQDMFHNTIKETEEAGSPMNQIEYQSQNDRANEEAKLNINIGTMFG